ncbi:MAG: PIN domain-containing protein [Verrucomicrobiota bacterium]|jgi:predicted nucleic acid-binding protein
MSQTIMDSGPLVAWFSKRDSHHEWATRVFEDLPAGVLVCEAVLAEVCHLVAKDGVPSSSVLKLVEQNDLVLVSLVGEVSDIRALMERYKDAPMDFADACVVRMSELNPGAAVCTTDGHFRFFRKSSGEIIALLAPFAG